MSEASLNCDSSVESLVGQVADEFLRRQRQGEQPDIAEYLQHYPQAAHLLGSVLASLRLLDLSQAGAITSAASDASAELGGVLGDFRIIREVGRGGMGVVYEAEQISLRRRVALKVLPFAATMDPRHLQRFHNEAQAAACLHHTNIVPVFSVGCERGVHFYAMQFIDGQPLSEVIRQLQLAEQKKPSVEGQATIAYPPSGVECASTPPAAEITPLTAEGRRSRDYYRKVAELGIQAAEALDHAHQLGVVHRDIKPGNLMLDVRVNLWVTDFGLAHMQEGEANLTMTGQAVGTPRYMSPEQASAKRAPIDHRTDVYSLGVTLYELLTLRPAFACEDRQELMRQIAFEEPPRPRRLKRMIPAELETIVLKAMEKGPQDRYATAKELADDLRHWLEDKPIRAKRPSWIQTARKWARRRRAVVGSTAVILFMACLFLVGSFSWIAGERSERRKTIERVVGQALEESFNWQRVHDWAKARAAVMQAFILSGGGVVNEELRRRVRQRNDDLTLLDELNVVEYPGNEAAGPIEAPGSVYQNAFQRWGLDLNKVQLEEAIDHLRGSSVSNEIILIRALDIWAVACLHARGAQDTKGLLLLRLANAIDWDEERNHFRATLQDGSSKLLRDLKSPEIARRLVPASQYYLLPLVSQMKVAELLDHQRQHPDDVHVNQNLGNLFASEEPPRCDEAIRFFTAALALNPQAHNYHVDIGKMLEKKGDANGAKAEYYEALRLSKDTLGAAELGDLLIRLGNIDEAIAVYRKTIAARTSKDPSCVDWHCLLGDALRSKGLYADALVHYRRGHELSLNLDRLGWPNRDGCAAWVRLGERLRQVDTKLSLVLEGKARPANAEECLELAHTSHWYMKCNVAAARLFSQAFSKEPRLADNLQKQERYNAACTAVLAGCGQGKDADKLDAKERARLRRQALDWLRADLQAYRQMMEQSAGAASPIIQQWTRQWWANPDLSGVMQDKAVAKLPEAERKEWQKLWRELQTLQQALQFEIQLSRVLEGKEKLDDWSKYYRLVQLARQCFLYKKFYIAVRLLQEAFSEKPLQADNLENQNRYLAARAAALAGCGQGKDSDKLDIKERARLRQQALDWLRADLQAYRQMMEQSRGSVSPMIAQRMQHWLANTDFAGVHSAKEVAKLPEAERQESLNLWQEVEAMRQRADQWLAKLPEMERQKWLKFWQKMEAMRQRNADYSPILGSSRKEE